MKKSNFGWSIAFPLTVLTAALCFDNQVLRAQDHESRNLTQQPSTLLDDQNAVGAITFSGRIVKSGNKLVLAGSDNLTTYQLDDQQRAHEFLNKSVKVTGSLDASTGTIRVRAIDPALSP